MNGCHVYAARLSAVCLGVAFGILSALWMMFFAWYAYFSGNPGAMALVAQWTGVTPGFEPTLLGGVIGGVWGFVEGFICGLVLGWVYNGCLCCCRAFCKSCKSDDEIKK